MYPNKKQQELIKKLLDVVDLYIISILLKE
ncbi:hypothetical protein [Clostridioides difficile]